MGKYIRLLAVMLAVAILPLTASAEECPHLGEGALWEVSPFLIDYRDPGEVGRDYAALYRLTWGDGTIPVFPTQPGSNPGAGDHLPENLEEGGISGKLRAVILGGYPHRTLRELEGLANPWLVSHGLEPLAQLQAGEALTATQMALWQLLGSCQDTQYGGWKSMEGRAWSALAQALEDSGSLSQAETPATASNIASLRAYLEALAPVAAGRTSPTEDALAGASYWARETEEGISVGVTVPLGITPRWQDSLTLEAQCAGQCQSLRIEGEGPFTFEFSGLSCPETVTLTLTGTWQYQDVCLFSRGEQRLIGYVAGNYPVFVQIDLEPERALEIRKVTVEGQPMANVSYQIYLAATAEALERGEARLSDIPTAREVDAIRVPERLKAVITTDEAGLAAYQFDAAEDPDGVYLVVEGTGGSSGTEASYITIPGEMGGTLRLRLEEDRESGPDITLSVEGQDHGSFALGQGQQWRILTTLPAGLAGGRSYAICDTLPQGLEAEPDSLCVTLETGTEETLHLVEGSHFTAVVREGTVQVALTPGGMAYAGSREEGTRLAVSFRAAINALATPGQPMANRATLEYRNSAGLQWSETSPWVEVTTGALNIRKTGGNGRGLSGAVFRLARDARAGEEPQDRLTVDGTRVAVVYESFCQGQALTGLWTDQVTTDENGQARISGLAWGSYYLVETRSPPGYRTPEAVRVEVNGDTTDTWLDLAASHFILPNTGGVGSFCLTLLGCCAIALACWLLVWQHRQREGQGI